MRKFLVGAIFGALVADNAGASIISRSFLDQALTDYATNTALDLKADKADVTDLSDKIGDAWPYGSDMSGGLYSLSWQLYPQEINLENASDLVRFLFGGEIESGINQGGVLNILGESVVNTGAYDINTGQIDEGFRSLLQLTDGWADSKGNIYLGVKGLNDKIDSIETKIDTLPTSRINSFTAGEQNAEIMDFLATKNLPVTYPRTLARFMYEMYDIYLHTMFAGWTDTTGKEYGGLIDLNNQIGTLPSGDMRTSKGLVYLLPDPEYYTYPTSIGDFMGQMYGGYLGVSGLAEAVYFGNEFMGQTDTTLQVKGLRQITDEIGTLPSGNFPEFPEYEALFSRLKQPFTYPTSLAELITAIYGNSETGVGLLAAIITGFPVDRDGDGGTDEYAGLLPNLDLTKDAIDLANANATKIGTVPDGKNLAGMISETDAKIGAISPNTTVADLISKTNAKFGVLPPDTTVAGMIGTLPDEYSTVGAALTAMKSDIDAKNLPSTSDDGQYVLSAKKVGDTITYTWVKMDLTNEEQAQ